MESGRHELGASGGNWRRADSEDEPGAALRRPAKTKIARPLPPSASTCRSRLRPRRSALPAATQHRHRAADRGQRTCKAGESGRRVEPARKWQAVCSLPTTSAPSGTSFFARTCFMRLRSTFHRSELFSGCQSRDRASPGAPFKRPNSAL